jgi:hypothetical protein
MRGTIFYAHSGLRYLVLLAGVTAVAVLGWATMTGRPFDSLSRRVMAAFSGLMDLQILLGVVLLSQIPFYPALAGHLTMMVAAAVVAHVGAVVNRRRPPEQQSNAVLLGVALVALLLILGGILAIGRPIVGSA